MSDLFRKDSKEKNEKPAFDINSFLSVISPLKTKPKLEKKASNTSDTFLDITQETKLQKPTLSASAQRLLAKVDISTNKVSADVSKARKEFEKGIKEITIRNQQKLLNNSNNDKKTQQTQRPQSNGSSSNLKKMEAPKVPIKKPPSKELLEVTEKIKQMNRDYDRIKKDPKKMKEFNDLLARKKKLLSNDDKDSKSSSGSSSDSDSSSDSESKKIIKKPIQSKKTPNVNSKSSNAINSKTKVQKNENDKGGKKNNEYSPLEIINTDKSQKKSAKSTDEKAKSTHVNEYDPLGSNPKGLSSNISKSSHPKQPIDEYEKPLSKKVNAEEKPKKHEVKVEVSKSKESSHSRKKPPKPFNPYGDDDDEDDVQASLAKLFGKHRQKMQKTKYLDYIPDDNMEAGFDEIEYENYVSRKVGEEEDRIELERIKKQKKKKSH